MEETSTPIIETPHVAAPARRPALQVFVFALLITATWLVMTLWGLGKAPFHTKGEPREGLVVWEMTHGGGWILPMRNGVEIPSKPPLFHWLGAATALVHGATDEWSIRFPSAALSLLSLLGVLFAGAALWNPRAGLIAALALMTTFEWGRAATSARVDMTLTFGLQAAFLCLLFFLRTRSPRWLVPLYVSVALAVLGKGFVGALLPGLVAVSMIAVTRDWRLFADLKPLRGLAIVGVLAGLWYVLAVAVGGWSFFSKQILGEQLFTFVSNPASGWSGHRHSLAYLPGALLLGLLPWTPFFGGVAVDLWHRRQSLTRNDPRIFLLVWILVVFLFYEIAAQKRSVYLLALYPAAALLLGAWWDRQLAQANDTRLTLVGRWLGLILLALLVPVAAISLLQGVGVPLLEAVAPWLSRSDRFAIPGIAAAIRSDPILLAGLLLVSMAGLALMARGGRKQDWRSIFAGLLVATVSLHTCGRLVFLPGIAEQQTFRDLMREVRASIGEGADLRFYNSFEYGAVFYYGGHIPAQKALLASDAPRYLLTTPGHAEQLQRDSEVTYTKVDLANDVEDKMKNPLILLRRVDRTP